MKLILASGSPRRQEMLKDCGIQYLVDVSGAVEVRAAGETPQQMAERLAFTKAHEVASRHQAEWVLGADTDVYIDGEILGKPRDPQDAKRLLNLIQGRTHVVWGAFALLNLAQQKKFIRTFQTRVSMRKMNQAEISAYVATGDPLDKAGAYTAQGFGAQFIESIEGSYSNVIGLNLAALMQLLEELKLDFRA